MRLLLVAAFIALALAQGLPAQITLVGTCRDFTPQTNPDFESFGGGVETGMVQRTLDADGKPQYVPGAGQITSAASFYQWYRDVPGVNIPYIVPINLDRVGTSDIYSYTNQNFFPLDGRGFGDYENYGHNFHFTCQFANRFTYEGGESLQYIGDDDVWVFINGILAIDIGGVHGPSSSGINLDDSASDLGITIGNDYDLVVFQAERHTVGSTIRIDTSILLRPNFPNPTNPKVYCSLVDPNDFTYGQGYYCFNGGFVQCYGDPITANYQNCPAGTSCQCAVGLECSNHGTSSPCTTLA